MNKKNLLILGIFFIITLSGISFFYQKDLFIDKYLGYDVFFSKNNSEIQDALEANNNDTITYHIVLPKDLGEKINIDTTVLQQYIDIEKIEVNGKEIKSQNDITGIQDTQITIIGKPKVSIDFNKTQELIKITPTVPVKDIKKENLFLGEIQINKTRFLSDFNNVIELIGSGQTAIEFVIIGDKSFALIEKENKFFVNIPKNTFKNGEYLIFLQDRNKNITSLDHKISFTFSDNELNVQNIVPNVVSNSKDQNIILQGRGFSKTISLQLSNNIVLKDTNFIILSDNVLQVKLPKGIPVGAYQINVMTTKNIYQIQENPLSITN